ncbi:MAG: hypothetical protein ACR2MQ_05655, partial [Gemmatimonadaceae bacterium]
HSYLCGSTRRRETGLRGVGLAGASAFPPPTPAPIPVPSPGRVPTSVSPAIPATTRLPHGSVYGGPWSFSYAPGTYTYSVTTEAVVAPTNDTMQKRVAPTPPERATIAVGADGTVQVISPTPATTGACDASAASVTRAQQMITRLPSRITGGESWSDSTTTDGCRGSIPATSHVAHTYTVLGDTVLAIALTGATVPVTTLHVHRDDVIAATGEGAEGQHRVLVSATGTGSAELFFDVATGRFLESDGVQNSTVDINTSGRVTRFVQHVAQHVTLTGSP